jgi:translation initiation factor IF-1
MPEPAGREETLEVEGTVRELLPGALYRVELVTDARPSVTAHLAGGTGSTRLRPGDGVIVAIAAFDAGRGRIVRRR